MNPPELPIRMLEPEQVAPDTHVVRQLVGEGVAPVAVFVNSMVITGAEPVLVDAGPAVTRESWLEATFSVVEPGDVRWIFLSHDDPDHVGNLLPVLDLCPDATLVTTSFMVERMRAEFGMALPMHRMRWVNDGESFHAGDRELVAKLPPVFDSPTTRGLFDTSTGVYWASDAMGSPVTHEVSDVSELDPWFWHDSFSVMNRMLSPWHQWLDPVRYGRHLESVRSLGAAVVASSHGPALRGDQIEDALELMAEIPDLPAAPLPDQAELEAAVAAMAAASGSPTDASEVAA